MTFCARGALLVAALSLLPLPVFAATPADTSAARVHYDRGVDSYRHGNYRDAIREFEAAYQAKPHGVIFFNLAQAYEKLGELDLAKKNYEEYLKTVPDAPDRTEVVAAIANLERRMGKDVPLPPPPPSGTVVQPELRITTVPTGANLEVDDRLRGLSPLKVDIPAGPHAIRARLDGYEMTTREVLVPKDGGLDVELKLEPVQRSRFYTWVALGVAGAAAATGAGFGLAAKSSSNELLATRHAHDEAQALHDAAQGRARTANVLYGVGGAAALAGVGLFFLEGSF